MPLAPLVAQLLADNWEQVEACPTIRLDLHAGAELDEFARTAGVLGAVAPSSTSSTAVSTVAPTLGAVPVAAGDVAGIPTAGTVTGAERNTVGTAAAVTPGMSAVKAVAVTSASPVTVARTSVELVERSPAVAIVSATVCRDE